MLVQFETILLKYHLKSTGSFSQEAMAGHSASIGLEHINFSVSSMM
jgi:hypothetical protein